MSSRKSGSAKPGGSGEKTDVTSSFPESTNQSEAADMPVDVKDDLRQIPPAKKRQFEKHWKKDWVEVADFFVSFGYEVTKSGEKKLQTRVIHYEGEKEQQWKNIAQDSLVEWMLDQAKPSLPSDAELQSREPALKEAQPEESVLSFLPLLEITDWQVSEDGAQGSSGLQKGNLRTECLLRLPASAREFTESCLSVVVEAHLINLQTNRSTIMSSEIGQLSPGEFVYEISQDFPLPAKGSYRLYVSARLLPPGEASAQIQGPVIYVEP